MSQLLHAQHSQFLRATFTVFARVARKHGISDQEMAEWFLGMCARWLFAHGVSAQNIHGWIAQQLSANQIVPMVAGAAAKNDFGGRR